MHKIFAELRLISSANMLCYGDEDGEYPYLRNSDCHTPYGPPYDKGDGQSNFAGNGGCNVHYFDFFSD